MITPTCVRVAKIAAIMGRDALTPVLLNHANNEIKDQSLSSDKAKDVLGWEPRWKLDKGLGETFRWYEKFIHENPTLLFRKPQ